MVYDIYLDCLSATPFLLSHTNWIAVTQRHHPSSPQLTLSARPLSRPVGYKRHGNCTHLSRAFTGLDPPLFGSARQDRYPPWQHDREEYRNVFRIARNRSANNRVAEKITCSSNPLSTVTSVMRIYSSWSETRKLAKSYSLTPTATGPHHWRSWYNILL